MRGAIIFAPFVSFPIPVDASARENYRASFAEVEDAISKGFIEITLLGQNVNSWRDRDSGETFAELIAAVGAVPGVNGYALLPLILKISPIHYCSQCVIIHQCWYRTFIYHYKPEMIGYWIE